MASITNPYANPDGSPKDGQAKQFFEWAEKKYNAELEKKSDKERAEEKKMRTHLDKKMNS